MRGVIVLTLYQFLTVSTTLAEYKGYLSFKNLHQEEAPLIFKSEDDIDSIPLKFSGSSSGFKHKMARDAHIDYKKDGIIFEASDFAPKTQRHYIRHPIVHSPYSKLTINSASDLWRKMEKLEKQKEKESKEKGRTAFRLSFAEGGEREDDEPLFKSFFSYVKTTKNHTQSDKKKDKVGKPVSSEKQKGDNLDDDEIAFLTSNGGVQTRQCPEGKIWKDNRCLAKFSIG